MCDATDFYWYTDCSDLGLTGGALGCNNDCTFDTSVCGTGDTCQDWGYYNDGWCDVCELYPGGHADPDCAALCGLSNSSCDSWLDDTYFVSTCLFTMGYEDPDCGVCGDNTADDTEWCDGTDSWWFCSDFDFSGGTATCDASCNLVLTGCTP
jgi:hypothetical protein